MRTAKLQPYRSLLLLSESQIVDFSRRTDAIDNSVRLCWRTSHNLLCSAATDHRREHKLNDPSRRSRYRRDLLLRDTLLQHLPVATPRIGRAARPRIVL